MESGDWDEIVFDATYPMAKIRYIDKQLPIEITAAVFSPFIPLDEKNSSLPCTIYDFTFTNKSKEKVLFDVLGWLENKVLPKSAIDKDQRINQFFTNEKYQAYTVL